MAPQTQKKSIVLFSGGSASNLLSAELIRFDVELTQAIVVFDNGGSTGELRRLCSLPAMGDIRNRLVALAASATPQQAATKAIFDIRFPSEKPRNQLQIELRSLVDGSNRAWNFVSEPHKNAIIPVLGSAVDALPADFALTNLSIGNLLLFGYTIKTGCDLLRATDWARHLLEVPSRILPVTLTSCHLGARSKGGWILGQKDLTKELSTPTPPLERICLLAYENSFAFEVTPPACTELLDAMERADALVLGFGSFHTSILPHFLVNGVAKTFASRQIPKFFLCNPTRDRETQNHTVASMLRMIGDCTKRHVPSEHQSSVISRVVRFGFDETTRIPKGDLTAFENGGKYVEAKDARTVDAVADAAAHDIVNTIGASTVARHKQVPHAIKTVVLFDLDSTLFDNARLRLDATSAALEGLVEQPRHIAKTLLDLTQSHLSEALVHFGLANLRHSWDSLDMFAIAIMLSQPTTRASVDGLKNSGAWQQYLRTGDWFADARALRYCALQLLKEKKNQIWLENIRATARDISNGNLVAAQNTLREFVEENAKLNDGAQPLIDELRNMRIEVHVVSEGESAVQNFKFHSLGLGDLVKSCVVTDVTCGVSDFLTEVFDVFVNDPNPPQVVGEVYNQLSDFRVKSAAFYGKLLHALAASGPADLTSKVRSINFLTKSEWEAATPPAVIMIGDQYKKDIQPLLSACATGVTAFRVLTGKYYRDDSLPLLIDEKRFVPHGVYPDLHALTNVVTAVAKTPSQGVVRAVPKLPSPRILDEFSKASSGLTDNSRMFLAEIKAEAERQRAST